MRLVELCAGSAAVTLATLGVRPPASYVGSKRRYAPQIIAHLGLRRPTAVVLVDPGPWGEVWPFLIRQAGEVVSHLEGFLDRPDEQVFAACRDAFLGPARTPRFAAAFVWLQSRVLRNLPVDGRWKYTRLQMPHGDVRDPYKGRRVPTTAGTIRKVAAIGAVDWPVVDIIAGRAEEIPPSTADAVYIDPPYRCSTISYAHDFARPAVAAVGAAWAAAGATVAISEQEPVDIPGWSAVDITIADPRRSLARNTAEWLTLSPSRTT